MTTQAPQSGPPSGPKEERKKFLSEHDPHLQSKFLVIFGLFALLPLVLFWQFGLQRKPDPASPVSSSSATPPKISFKDVTAASGLTFRHNNGAAGEKLLPETMGSGCAFIDFDSDGDQDILFVNSTRWPWSQGADTTPALYQNDGHGKFSDVTRGSGLDSPFYGMGAAVGDFDNDGLSDLFLTGLGGCRLFQNRGAGKFQDVTATAGVGGATTNWSSSAAFVDYDRDGDLDLAVCNYVQWSRELDLAVDYSLPGIGRAYGPPMNFAGTFPILYRNDGRGTFSDVSATAGVRIQNRATGLPLAKALGIAPVDLDNDGWIDLVIANDTVQNFVLHNNRNGTFTEIGGRSGLAFDRYGSVRGAMGIDTGKFQDDDTLAISIGNFANEATGFYVAQDNPLFFSDQAWDAGIGAPSRSILTFGVCLFDYDLDGFLDLLTVNGHIEPDISKVHSNQSYLQPAQLFWNTGRKAGRFVLVAPDFVGEDLSTPIAGRGSAYADVDGDGDLDVLMTQVNGAARLLRNEQSQSVNWLRLKLIGTKSNRDAIGAWVKIRAGNRTISQQVMPTRGYLSQSELPVTIGLGKIEKITTAEITWPDGSKQSFSPLLNRLTEIRQP